ncbi:MAG TPA: exodeoxyribonuclease V subunit gamma [Rhodanobacteraceae bacterium]|nr:exodeoxyribonuclease V subunit gamma [Rhodanobacteraceae bacterium]
MFRLHTSNDAARLAAALGERLCGPRDNPLAPARVLVPQAGLRRWLQVTLAERHGVIANVEFTPPAQFAWELLRAASPGLPRQSPFDVDVLRWHLYKLLGERLEGAALERLRAYLDADRDPLRRYALSFELARMYERLQGYRRDKLLQWEHGVDPGDWQAEVWRRLLPRVGGVSRVARVDAWLRAYDPWYPAGSHAEKPAPPGLPAQLSCFACANVSPDVLRMLAVAGLHCDVDFFLPLPSREYLGDTPRSRRQVYERLRDKDGGNPLIASLGGAAAEFIELLYGYQHVQPGEETDDFDEAIPRATLLGRVRGDILDHVAPRADDRQPSPDDSLQFRACHTPLREVETLHDALLGMFEDDRFDPPLQPRDIAVMMPDVAAYRPAIDAVFGGVAREDARFVPWNLGDTGASALHPVAQVFLDLLDAPTSRWQGNEILDVLAVPGVMRRFDLDTDAVERLSARVRDAGVRWGESEQARADCGGYREFSWAFGIDRMLAGFACGDDDADTEPLVGGTAPLDGIEGAAFAHLDAVLAVTETWRRLRELSQRARTAGDWQRVLNEVLDSLYQPDPRDLAETRALERVRAALEKLADDCDHADAGLELPWPEVRAFLREQLAAADPQQYLFTGGVTFCGMVPLRVVPFRVICLLGMDASAFPRRETGGLDPLVADRRAGHAMRGDRDVRADDRLLFLQLLAAARDAFYVSWIGRDPHTNKEQPPSAVVAELIDVVKQGCLLPAADEAAKQARDALPRVEPLHPFATTLFGGDGHTPRSYRAEWIPSAQTTGRGDGIAPFVGELAPPADNDDELHLDTLKRFYRNPARGLLEQALALRLPREADRDADVEPLRPDDPLLRYQLTTVLLERGEADAARQRDRLRAEGRLPPGALADAALGTARDRARILEADAHAFSDGATPGAIEGRAGLVGGVTLAGTVEGVYPAGLLRAIPAGLNGKRAAEAWIDTLFAAAVGGRPTGCRVLWLDGSGDKLHVEARDIAAVDPATALAALDGLVQGMLHGLQIPLPLLPRASWEALKRWRQKGGTARGEFDVLLRSRADREDDDDFGGRGDFADPAIAMVWRGHDFSRSDPLPEAWYATACRVFPELQPLPKTRSSRA